jgi:hypothetical protein
MADAPFQRARFDADLVFKALKDRGFRARLLANPTKVYGEELRRAAPGKEIPEGVEIKIAEEAENVFYVILPCIPRQCIRATMRCIESPDTSRPTAILAGAWETRRNRPCSPRR